MPRKIRNVIRDLERAGFANRGGKGSHRNFAHSSGKLVTVSGKDGDEVYAELCQAVEEIIEILEKDGHPLPEPLAPKKFSGKFVLRVDPALHRRLAMKAQQEGESFDS